MSCSCPLVALALTSAYPYGLGTGAPRRAYFRAGRTKRGDVRRERGLNLDYRPMEVVVPIQKGGKRPGTRGLRLLVEALISNLIEVVMLVIQF